MPDKTNRANRRPASPFDAWQQSESRSRTLPGLSATVAHLCRSAAYVNASFGLDIPEGSGVRCVRRYADRDRERR